MHLASCPTGEWSNASPSLQRQPLTSLRRAPRSRGRSAKPMGLYGIQERIPQRQPGCRKGSPETPATLYVSRELAMKAKYLISAAAVFVAACSEPTSPSLNLDVAAGRQTTPPPPPATVIYSQDFESGIASLGAWNMSSLAT